MRTATFGVSVPKFERPFEHLEELHETELEELKLMFGSGVPLALTAAMAYCVRHGLTPPPWVISESLKVQCAQLRGDTPKKPGRSNGVVERYRQDSIDFARWEWVVEICENRTLLQSKIDELSKIPGRAAREHRNEYEKLLKRLGKNYDDAFACASIQLRGTPAKGKADAVRTSFWKVQRNMRDQATAMRYHILNSEFVRSVGAITDPSDGQGKKVSPLFDLTT
jgi:hypothetical protein